MNNVIDFLIVALAIFLIVRQFKRMKEEPEKKKADPVVKDCPYCFKTIPIKATRCPECTSELKASQAAAS